MRQLLHALHSLHSLNICHRDVKPENILVKETAEGPLIKLIDFNISHHSKHPMIAQTGTKQFMAPEMVASSSYDFRIDLWGAGCILVFLCLNKLPHNGSQPKRVLMELEEMDNEECGSPTLQPISSYSFAHIVDLSNQRASP
jgi:serine/threonine protein kinase